MDHFQLTRSLTQAFNALADEVQLLADRRTVLEHKLRYAHEQFQYLADKYAPAAPEIAETLAKLQLPSSTTMDETSSVPLPKCSSPQSQHHLAVAIRDGRRLAAKLLSLTEKSKMTGSSRVTFSQSLRDRNSSMTALEKDFTVEGRKGNLECPFSKPTTKSDDDDYDAPNEFEPKDRHQLEDPICAALSAGSNSHVAPRSTAASKCPIRFMDKHSAEEIAHYVETHKHELPRSHEVCLRRYQKNEDQMKKLDSKYGNIVSMIEGLSQLHQPMLPEDEEALRLQHKGDGASNKRVENWAHAVREAGQGEPPKDCDRQGRFDCPLKEVRVGESPSRPWGISVPVDQTSNQDQAGVPTQSPPTAPVQMPGIETIDSLPSAGIAKCPFQHGNFVAAPNGSGLHVKSSAGAYPSLNTNPNPFPNPYERSDMPTQHPQSQPVFIQPQPPSLAAAGNPSHITLNGPVFIGYPVEQALQFLNRSQSQT